MRPQQTPGSVPHSLNIEGVTDKPGVAQAERIVNPAVDYRIPIVLALIIVAHTKMLRHFPGREDGNFQGQIALHGIGNLFRWNRPGAIEVDDLAAGMYTCIRPGSTINRNRAGKNLSQSFFQKLLNRRRIFLFLKAVKIRAVIGHGQTDILFYAHTSHRITPRITVKRMTTVMAILSRKV